MANYRWIIVAAGGLLGCVAFGAMFSLPVFLLPMSHATGWSVTGISAAMTIGFLAMAAGSLFWGSLSDRIGTRTTVLIGAVVLPLSLLLASLTHSLILFQLLFGLGMGASASAIFAPMMACVTGWFDTQRSLAVSLVSAGMGMAPITLSPLAAWLISTHDWRTSMQVIAAIAACLMIPTAFLVRRPPALDTPLSPALSSATAPPEAPIPLKQLLRSPQYIVLVLTNFLCCATHSGPIFHTVSYALSCGIPMMAAVTIYSVEGLAGMGAAASPSASWATGWVPDACWSAACWPSPMSLSMNLSASMPWPPCSASSMPASCLFTPCWHARPFPCA